MAKKKVGKIDSFNLLYDGMALFADPVHQYIAFTVSVDSSEKSEKDLIDSPWLQRLRQIYQLQSSKWVFPSAEHSRFQHSIGAMHVAGRVAKHLYPSLKKIVKDCPSENFIEELLRVTALLHDVGHGPFGHFFDENFLSDYGITHEDIGQSIIEKELGRIIKQITRSPNGFFLKNEKINPEHVAFLIKKDGVTPPENYPRWLQLLLPLFNGIYTVDNMDYVLRDSYMCGIAIGPVDIERLIYYSFYTEEGLTIHKSGTSALTMFLNARLYLYSNVYYHRTTRAIDMHLKEIFKETLNKIFPYNPIERRREYLELTDWSLAQEVTRWKNSDEEGKMKLSKEWSMILNRLPKWKMVYGKTISIKELETGKTVIKDEDWEKRIRTYLPQKIKNYKLMVDTAVQDPRPENPLSMEQRQIYIYDPITKTVSTEMLKELFEYIPSKIIHYRVFAQNHDYDKELSDAAEKGLKYRKEAIKTNV